MSSSENDFTNRLCFFEGRYIPLKEANINVRTHALQYSTACFGGIRGYYNAQKNNIFLFRLKEHYERLHRSAKILQMKLNYSVEELIEISVKILKESNWRENVYLRPFVYKSGLDISPRLHQFQDDFYIYAIPLGDYMDTKKGLSACVSSFVRIHDKQMPTKAKATGGYLNSAFAKSEALQNGFDEGIFLDLNGNVSEGSAENIFLVKDNVLITPDSSSSILEGITRKTIIEIAKDLGIPLIERKVDRFELYTADELFFVGTGVQVAWISSVDHRIIASGSLGPITKKIQDLFFNIVNGNEEKYKSWLTPLY